MLAAAAWPSGLTPRRPHPVMLRRAVSAPPQTAVTADAIKVDAVKPLFQPFELGRFKLEHRLVYPPLTRLRATIDNVPVPIMAEYCECLGIIQCAHAAMCRPVLPWFVLTTAPHSPSLCLLARRPARHPGRPHHQRGHRRQRPRRRLPRGPRPVQRRPGADSVQAHKLGAHTSLRTPAKLIPVPTHTLGGVAGGGVEAHHQGRARQGRRLLHAAVAHGPRRAPWCVVCGCVVCGQARTS